MINQQQDNTKQIEERMINQQDNTKQIEEIMINQQEDNTKERKKA